MEPLTLTIPAEIFSLDYWREGLTGSKVALYLLGLSVAYGFIGHFRALPSIRRWNRMDPQERSKKARLYAIGCSEDTLHPVWTVVCFVRHLFTGLAFRFLWAFGRTTYMIVLWPLFCIITGSKVKTWPSWKKTFGSPAGCPPTRFVFPA